VPSGAGGQASASELFKWSRGRQATAAFRHRGDAQGGLRGDAQGGLRGDARQHLGGSASRLRSCCCGDVELNGPGLADDLAAWRVHLGHLGLLRASIGAEQRAGTADDERFSLLVKISAVGQAREPSGWEWAAIFELSRTYLREETRVGELVRSRVVQTLLRVWRPDKGEFARTAANDDNNWLVGAGCLVVEALACSAAGRAVLHDELLCPLVLCMHAWARELMAASPTPSAPAPLLHGCESRSVPLLHGGLLRPTAQLLSEGRSLLLPTVQLLSGAVRVFEGALDSFALPSSPASLLYGDGRQEGRKSGTEGQESGLAAKRDDLFLRCVALELPRTPARASSSSPVAEREQAGASASSFFKILELGGTLGARYPALLAVLAASPQGSGTLDTSAAWPAMRKLLRACDQAAGFRGDAAGYRGDAQARLDGYRGDALAGVADELAHALLAVGAADSGLSPRALLADALECDCESLRLCAVAQLARRLEANDSGHGEGACEDDNRRHTLGLLARQLLDRSAVVLAAVASALEQACEEDAPAVVAAMPAAALEQLLLLSGSDGGGGGGSARERANLAASSEEMRRAGLERTRGPGSEGTRGAEAEVVSAAYGLLCRMVGTEEGFRRLQAWVPTQLERWRAVLSVAYVVRVETMLLAKLCEYDRPTSTAPGSRQDSSGAYRGRERGDETPSALSHGVQRRSRQSSTEGTQPGAEGTQPGAEGTQGDAQPGTKAAPSTERLERPRPPRAPLYLRAGAPTPLLGGEGTRGAGSERTRGVGSEGTRASRIEDSPVPLRATRNTSEPPALSRPLSAGPGDAMAPRVHLYGELARTKRGRQLLLPVLAECIAAAANPDCAPRDRRAAVWAVVHVLAVPDGWRLADELRILFISEAGDAGTAVEVAVHAVDSGSVSAQRARTVGSGGREAIRLLGHLAKMSTTISLRGSCASALGFLGRFAHAHRALAAVGWAAHPSGTAVPTAVESLLRCSDVEPPCRERAVWGFR